MGIALFSAAGLIESLHGVIGWLAPREQPSGTHPQPKVWHRSASARHRLSQASRGSHPGLLVAHAAAHNPALPLPCATVTRQVARVARSPRSAQASAPALRVVRVLEALDAASSACAGRMVISGRMADVCAELDRLAALEAARPAALTLN